MYEIYQESKDKEDGFLYITYSDVEGFGGDSLWEWERVHDSVAFDISKMAENTLPGRNLT